jgi:formylglycine-generating enzyme
VSADGTSNCLPDSESCCDSPEVPGGTYYRIYDPLGMDGGVDPVTDAGLVGELLPATISTFRLDKYDVTVGRYRPFYNALNAGWTPPNGSGKHVYLNGGQGLTGEPGWTYDGMLSAMDVASCLNGRSFAPAGTDFETMPVACATWFEAYAFCIWDGGFLPTEAEWEYVAAGGDERRKFPWGSAPPGTENQYAIYNCYYGAGPNDAGGCLGLAPVGTASLGAGRWGQLDLSGNVWEWTLDQYAPYEDPCNDCCNLASPGESVVQRSCPFEEAPTVYYLLSTFRTSSPGGVAGAGFSGIRCARAP